MKVNKIALNGFRNYEWDTAEFSGGTNVISGRNAQGKTNLLEAVYMLSCGRSFRTIRVFRGGDTCRGHES